MNLNIAWEHPNATYGDVLSYEVVVTKEPLSEMESIDSAVSVIFTFSGTPTLNVRNYLYAQLIFIIDCKWYFAWLY